MKVCWSCEFLMYSIYSMIVQYTVYIPLVSSTLCGQEMMHVEKTFGQFWSKSWVVYGPCSAASFGILYKTEPAKKTLLLNIKYVYTRPCSPWSCVIPRTIVQCKYKCMKLKWQDVISTKTVFIVKLRYYTTLTWANLLALTVCITAISICCKTFLIQWAKDFAWN